jgi:hypothetical protein
MRMHDQATEAKSSDLAIKLLAASVCGILLSWGLCGIDAHLHPNAEFGGGAFAGIAVILFLISVLTLIGSLLVLFFRLVAQVFQRSQE